MIAGFGLREMILIAAYMAVGLAVYLSVHNFRLWAGYHVKRRWGYSLAYISVAYFVWEVVTYVVAPLSNLAWNFKSVSFFLSLVGFSIGITVIAIDHFKRRRAGRRPPTG